MESSRASAIALVRKRRLFPQVLETVKPDELWIFVIREHQTMPWEPVSDLKSIGQIDTGLLLEQRVRITNNGESLVMGRVLLRLFKLTQSGEKEVAIFTNLSSRKASTGLVASFSPIIYQGLPIIVNAAQ